MKKRRRIRIVRIQSRICIGGPAIHTEILSRYMPQSKYQTWVIGGAVDQYEHSKFEELRAKGINIQIIDEMKRDLFSFNDLRTVLKLYQLIKRIKPDIVETHTAKAGATGRIAAFLAKVPIITHTFHGHVFENYFGRFKTKLIILVERLLAKLSTRILVLSQSQKKDIVHKFKIAPASKIEMIPLGLELNRFSAMRKNSALKSELKIPGHDFLIAIIGRIVPIKNHAMIFRVINKLNDGELRAHLCVVGDGELRLKFEKDVDTDFVHFLGWQKNIEDIYAGVDLVALTSLNEGTPIVLIEAMAAGVPVVSTNVGGVADIILNGETGFTCNVNDDYEMKEKIKTLLVNKELKKKLTRQAKQFVLEKFNCQRLIRDMDLFYDRIRMN